MPREPGDVGGKSAKISVEGNKIDALYDFRSATDHDHLISHDGINASYLREHGREIVNDFPAVREAMEKIIAEAEQLYRIEKFREGHERVQRLRKEFKEAGYAGRDRQSEYKRRFEAAVQRFYDEQSRRRAERSKKSDEARKRKESLIFRARQLSDSSNWKETSAEYRRLSDEWKKAGHAGDHDQELWEKFKSAKQRFFERQNAHFDQRKKQSVEAKYRKERLVSEAREISRTNNFGEGFTRLRDLQARWKQAGHAGDDEDRLWGEFRAAGNELRRRADAQRHAAELRKRELISEASSIASDSDLRTAGLQWKSLMERWKAAGRSSREIEDDLWSRLQSWKRVLDGRYEERRRQSVDRTREFLSRLEGNLAKARDALYRVESHLSDLRSRPPIRPGPRAWEFQSQRDAKISGLEMKRNDIARSIQDIERKIWDVRQQL
jgi:hypothetical protein